jgi:hypothetical protein
MRALHRASADGPLPAAVEANTTTPVASRRG